MPISATSSHHHWRPVRFIDEVWCGRGQDVTEGVEEEEAEEEETVEEETEEDEAEVEEAEAPVEPRVPEPAGDRGAFQGAEADHVAASAP